jgi:hypothetical protein
MQQAVLAFVGVILGAIIAGFVSLWQMRLVTARERKAQQIHREQERTDRREAFERETLLALQDAISDLRQVTMRDYERKVVLMAEQGPWPNPSMSLLLTNGWIEANERLIALRARAFDEELQKLVAGFGDATALAMTAQTQSDAEEWIVQAGSRLEEVNRRISELLPRLF